MRKLDQQAQKRILDYLHDRIAPAESPRQYGKALRGNLGGLWRYRVDDYRIIARVTDHDITVLILEVNRQDAKAPSYNLQD